MKTDLLAIDIGNTSISAGLFLGKRLLKKERFETKIRSQKAWNASFATWLRKTKVAPESIEQAIICSVVPDLSKPIQRALQQLIGNVKLVGKSVRIPIKNRYRHPRQVGQDRLLNAFSGFQQYGGPLIIVDFGTAITFDVVSKKGEYLGGIITPGFEIAAQALYERTALLPKVTLKKPKQLIGKSTQESILSGLIYGWSALIEGVVSRLKEQIGPVKVILTGGNARLITPYLKTRHYYNADLTLQGLSHL